MSDSPPRPSDRQPGVPSEIIRHYTRGVETNRLASGHGPVELERTKELARRFLPEPPARVLDVGGGPGIYSSWLASQGYEVDLIDPVPSHVEDARKRARSEGAPGGEPAFRAAVGDARKLDWPPETFDAVLLLGPLYHLTERDDRILALREALRATRPGGHVFGVGISRFASIIDGLFHDYLADPVFEEMVEQDLADGQHRNPTDRLDYFTTAFFHHPEGLAAELRDAGWRVQGLFAVDGPGWVLPGFPERWKDPRSRERILKALRQIEAEPTLLGLSAHIMAVGVRA